MNNPQMYVVNTSDLVSPQISDVTMFSNIEELEAFEEIFFNLLITGNKKIAKKYVKNYLKNFYREVY